MINDSNFWLIFEQFINVFENILLLLFNTATLGLSVNKRKWTSLFVIALFFLILFANSYDILNIFQNIIAIFTLSLFSIVVLNGKIFKKVAISII